MSDKLLRSVNDDVDIRCVADGPHYSWCGMIYDGKGKYFLDVDHALRNRIDGGYSRVCPKCLSSIRAVLLSEMDTTSTEKLDIILRNQNIEDKEDKALQDLFDAICDYINSTDITIRVELIGGEYASNMGRVDIEKLTKRRRGW